MAGRDDIEARVRSIYDIRKNGDLDGVMATFTSDARFRMAGHPELAPMTALVQGAAQLRELMQQFIAVWDWQDYHIQRVLVDGDRAAVYSRGTMYFGPKRVPIDTETFDLLALKDGKIADFVQFCDTHMAAKAMATAA